MANAGEKIGVAVSGGADSIFLLDVLAALHDRFGYTLSVLHVNHHLRRLESDADQRFVAEVAAARGLAFFCDSAPVEGGENLEQQARRLRREFFSRLLRKGLVSRVALGHTLTDQAETVLLRLFRGAGLRGLAGMRPVTSDGLIRPLLELTRDEVRSEAAALGLQWREDSSNQDRQFRRNLLRLDIIPQLRNAFHPHIEKVLAGTARIAQSEENYWEKVIEGLLPGIASERAHGLLIDVPAFSAQHPAVQRRLMRAALERTRADLRSIDSAHVDAIVALCARVDGHDRVQVPGVDALRSFDRLRLTCWPPPDEESGRRGYELAITLGRRTPLPFGAGEIEIQMEAVRRNGAEAAPDGDEEARFDGKTWREAVRQGAVTVRNWQPGDAYCPHGCSGSTKIKTLFQEGRVYLWDRKHWPVMEIGGVIGWVRGFGAAAHLAAPEPCADVVRLTYYK